MLTDTTQITDTQQDRITDGMKPLASLRQTFRSQLIGQQKGHGRTFREFLLEKRNHFRALDSSARLKRYCDVDKMIRYYDGDQYGSHDKNGVWTDNRQDGDFAYSIPVLAGHVDQALMQMLKTKIKYEFSAKDENNVNKQALARMCEQLAVEDFERMFTEENEYEETLNRILGTVSYRHVYWAPDADNPKTTKRAKVNVQKVAVGKSFTVTTDINAFEEIQLGQNNLHIPHTLSIQDDMSSSQLKSSSFLIERKLTTLHKAQWHYQVIIDASAAQITDQSRLIHEQQRSTTQTDAIVGSSKLELLAKQINSKEVEEEWIWMSPEEYGHFYFDVEESLPDGSKIKTEHLAGDVYPFGLLVIIIGNTVVRVRPINFKKKWVKVVLGKRLGKSTGAGFHSLIPMQDIVNDTFNLRYSVGMTHANPTKILDRRAAKSLNQVDEFLLVDPPAGGSIKDALHIIPGASANGDVMLTGEQIEAAMQFIAGTYTMGGAGGAADVKAMGTATGVAAVQEQAAGRMYPHIVLKIAADKETLFQILENWKEYAVEEQKKELAKRFGPDIVKLFFSCNFRQELNITIAQNSDMPRSMALTQANVMAYAQAAASLKDAPFANEILGLMADIMGLSVNYGTGRADKREAEYRLNKLAAIEEEIDRKRANVPDVEKVQLMLGLLTKYEGQLVMPFLQDQQAFMDTYKEWIFSDRAKASSMVMKAAVIEMWGMHFNATQEQDKEMAAHEVEVQQTLNPQPTPEEVVAANQQQQEQQAALAEEERQKALQDEALRYEAEESAKDAQLERDKEKREHEAQVEMMKAALESNNLS